MIDFVTWSLLVVGLTYAATMSFIFALPRMLISRLGTVPRYFVYCPMCMSFWFGALTYPFYTNEAPWTVSYFGNLVAAGFVAMGLVSVLKGFMPESPWDAEQGRDEEEITVGGKAPETGLVLGGPGGTPWRCARCGNGPLKYACRSIGLAGGICDLCLVSDETRKACPHRYTNVGPDRRCILCGADAPEEE